MSSTGDRGGVHQRKLKTVIHTQRNNQALKDGVIKPRNFEFDFEEIPVLVDGSRRMVWSSEVARHPAWLTSATPVQQRVTSDLIANDGASATKLTRWFSGHANYFDSALTQWMCKRLHRGRPAVLRRLAFYQATSAAIQ